MKKIIIKRSKDGTVSISGSAFEPVEFLTMLIDTLAYETCRLKKPGASADDLWVSASSALCTAIFDRFDEMYPKLIPDRFEWEMC